MKQTIKVTNAHIKLGQRGRHNFCPVSIALLEAGFDRVSVGDISIMFESDGYPVNLKTPNKVSNFINKFDNKAEKGGKKPFSFTLDFDDVYIPQS